jgi:IclR family acetate operon transcriptional repressor
MAYMPPAELEPLLSLAREQYTSATFVDRHQLLQEIERTRARGYALDDAEREVGVRCVAAPIFHSLGQVDAAISISGPSVRISAQHLRKLAEELIVVANEISQARSEPALA